MTETVRNLFDIQTSTTVFPWLLGYILWYSLKYPGILCIYYGLWIFIIQYYGITSW